MLSRCLLQSRIACIRSMKPNASLRCSSSVLIEEDVSEYKLQNDALKSLNIAICGGGTVGGGVFDILTKHKRRFELEGYTFNVKKLLVRDSSKARDFVLPEGCTLTTNINDVLEDDSIDVVVELMGGTDAAADLVFGAFQKGKHVVTANKALMSSRMNDIDAALKDNPSICLGYEASVCGGIPVIQSLRDGNFICDRVNQVAGILNGTTNYILSKMGSDGLEYSDVLKEAQDLGYAEADPTADVEGYDARSKIVLLSKLAFGVTIDETQVSCRGISNITADDFSYAEIFGCTVKLLGVGRRVTNHSDNSDNSEKSDNKLNVFVSPMMVKTANVIGQMEGPTNLVSIFSDNLDESVMIGPGAGRYPTANSVVSDLTQIASKEKLLPFPLSKECACIKSKNKNLTNATPSIQIDLDPDLEAEFYIRFDVVDQPGIISAVGRLCEQYGISIYAVHQNEIRNKMKVAFAVTTEKVLQSAVEEMTQEFAKLPFCRKTPMFMPFFVENGSSKHQSHT